MKLYQIPFSHNCVKVRWVLEHKGLDYEAVNINPTDRSGVKKASGQGLVPALIDGDEKLSDSTEILRYLENKSPEKPLQPEDPEERALVWLVEDWVDHAFMALTRRLVYWKVTTTPGAIGRLFFPEAGKFKQWFMSKMAKRLVSKRFGLSPRRNRHDEKEVVQSVELALARLEGRKYLVGDSLSVADVTLAVHTSLLWAARRPVSENESVIKLLEWGEEILGSKWVEFYKQPMTE